MFLSCIGSAWPCRVAWGKGLSRPDTPCKQASKQERARVRRANEMMFPHFPTLQLRMRLRTPRPHKTKERRALPWLIGPSPCSGSISSMAAWTIGGVQVSGGSGSPGPRQASPEDFCDHRTDDGRPLWPDHADAAGSLARPLEGPRLCQCEKSTGLEQSGTTS